MAQSQIQWDLQKQEGQGPTQEHEHQGPFSKHADDLMSLGGDPKSPDSHFFSF